MPSVMRMATLATYEYVCLNICRDIDEGRIPYLAFRDSSFVARDPWFVGGASRGGSYFGRARPADGRRVMPELKTEDSQLKTSLSGALVG